MILLIQTICKSTDIMTLTLEGEVVHHESWLHENRQSNDVLKKIDQILEGQKPEKIMVMSGMGSYTGTRIGVSIANALSFAWQIPIGALQSAEYLGDEVKIDILYYVQLFLGNPTWSDMILPVYNRAPKIG